jgi:hypothetical protein
MGSNSRMNSIPIDEEEEQTFQISVNIGGSKKQI